MFNKKTIRDIDVAGKRVLVRVDYNVPVKDGKVTDDTRITASLPTLEYLLDKGAALILCSHLGRPKDGPDPAYSMEPVAAHLSKVMNRPVQFCPEVVGEKAQAMASALKSGDILVIENTRFIKGETKNDAGLSQKLSDLAEVYVNDAFGSAHRAHSSTEGVAHILPGVAGFLMEKEIRYLGAAIANPETPFVAILGGAKIVDKIGVIRNLLVKADKVLIGGGMANTFFKAQGLEVGDSLVDADALDTAKEILASAGDKLMLPSDVVVADAFDNAANKKTVAVDGVETGWLILDIGPKTAEAYSAVIKAAGTVVWNGPMGVFEMPSFAVGTMKVAEAVAASKGTTIIGGGDSVAAVNHSGVADQVTHISTGGGASLEMLEGLVLPGLAILQDK